MRFGLMVEPQQGLSYAEQLDLARLAERLGFESFFRSDHYRRFPGPAGRPTTDAWTVLAGIARETERIRLGALVSPVTFRHPGSFVKVVTTVDEMSGGRVDVAVGAGWNEEEHRDLGLPFPDITQRADLLEDELQILHGLWEHPSGWSFRGKQLSLDNTSFNPSPVQRPHPPIIVGGDGKPRSIRLAARYADEYNMSNNGAEVCAIAFRRLDEECRAIGRDPASITRSAMVGLLIGRDEAEVNRRAAELIEFVGAGTTADEWLEQRRPRWVLGTPDQARTRLAEFEAAGAERVMLQDFLPRNHAMIELAAEELIGRQVPRG